VLIEAEQHRHEEAEAQVEHQHADGDQACRLITGAPVPAAHQQQIDCTQGHQQVDQRAEPEQSGDGDTQGVDQYQQGIALQQAIERAALHGGAVHEAQAKGQGAEGGEQRGEVGDQ